MVSWSVRTYEELTYRIHETFDCFATGNRVLAQAALLRPGARRLVVIDRRVHALHGRALRTYLGHHDVRAEVLILEAGERNKDLTTLRTILDAAETVGLNRRSDPIIAIGGGVLTDVVGLAASLYRRGTPFVRVPTTLIGIIDAGVGVKTGINYEGHKNRLGTYFPCADTILDRGFLRTLPARHISNGLAEAVKVAIMRDRVLFELLDKHVEELIATRFDCAVAPEVITHAVGAMLGELEPNLREHELRRLVDFGHTFSPALEMATRGAVLHGEAVAVDMALCTAIALHRGMVNTAEADRVFTLLRRANLPIHHEACTAAEAWRALEDSTRHRDGRQHCPLPLGLGRAEFVEDITPRELAHALALLTDLTVGARAA
ncbi:MAG TPA: sedoheptulose 7-phosphate cyclase [Pilimelia sp.]|nr:sedoheptulose 7-phosphate cyclase [Pilimelia sp.]